MKKLLFVFCLFASVSFAQEKWVAYSMSVLPGGGLWVADEPVAAITYGVTEASLTYWAIASKDKTQPILFLSLLKIGELLRLNDVLNKANMELNATDRLTLRFKL